MAAKSKKSGWISKKKEPKNIGVNVLVHVELFPYSVMFSFGEDDDTLSERLEKIGMSKKDLHSERHQWMPGSYGQYNMYPNGQFGLIRMHNLPSTSKDWGALAHEIFHVVACIAEQVGLQLLPGTSDEAYAYMISYITTELYEAINKYY